MGVSIRSRTRTMHSYSSEDDRVSKCMGVMLDCRRITALEALSKRTQMDKATLQVELEESHQTRTQDMRNQLMSNLEVCLECRVARLTQSCYRTGFHFALRGGLLST